MSRSAAPPLVWEQNQGAEHAGVYTIRLESPNRWQLTVSDRPTGIYSTRTAAANAAARLHRRLGFRRRLVRHLLFAGISLTVLLLALAQRTEPNPDYPPARAIADRFDAARLAVEAGEVDIEQVGTAFAGVAGGAFEHAGGARLGLAGIFDGRCYGLVWRPGFEPGGVAIRDNYVTCAPDSSLIVQPDTPGLVAEVMWPTWENVLPDQNRSPVWFLPVFIISFGVFFGSFVRATVLVLPASR